MKKAQVYFTKISLILAIAILGLSFFVFQISHVQAATGINRTINFQGKLVNNPAKTNVTDTSYTVVFSIYDLSSGGTALWSESQSVTTADGIFRVSLGSVTPFPANFNFNWDGRYLGIKVNADSEMTPRVQLAAVPYAFNSEKVSGLTVQDDSGNASTSGTLRVANAKTITFSNSLTFAGTDSTSFTFPTTTGGTVLTSNAPSQGVTSTQTSGTLLALSDSTGLSAAIKGVSITLSGGNAFDQTGLEFNLSNASGTNVNDIVGTGGTWKVSRAGALTVASCSGCGGGGG